MSTAWCMSVAFFCPWVVGAPVAWLIHRCHPLRFGDWLWVPFLGLAAIIYPLQQLVVFADWPLARTAPWFWAALGVAWAALLGHPSGRASLRVVPWRVLALVGVVYLGQGAGVVLKGVDRYRGDLMSDQYLYVAVSQFLADEPFSTDRGRLVDSPWLGFPLSLKHDRLGQGIVNGFLAATAGHDALDLFFPTILLGPALMLPAMLLLCKRCGLPRRWRTWAALTAALAPGVAVLVSLCFLSHALGLPVLVAFLAGAIRLARGGGLRPLTATAVTFGLGFSLYTEFAPLFGGTAVVALAAGVLRRHIGVTRGAVLLGALVVALGLNPAALTAAPTVWERGTTVGADMTTGHRTGVWVAAIWVHFEKAGAMIPRPVLTCSHALVYGGLAAVALCGIVFITRAVRSSQRLLPSCACASLLVPPVVLWVGRPEAAYVIGKLVISLTPILILFIASGLCSWQRHRVSREGRCAVSLLAVGFLVILAVQSGLEQRTWLRGTHGVGPARVWNDPDLQSLCAILRERGTADVVIVLTNGTDAQVPPVASAALCYYARHHRIRLVSPSNMWEPVPPQAPELLQTTVEGVRAGTLVVVRRGSLTHLNRVHGIVFENDTFQLIRLGELNAKGS
jgi:hypothetical protein